MKKEDVQKIANLSRLTLSDAEVESLTKDLTNIMGYVETLNELNLKDINPTAHAVKVQNVFREDEVKPTNVVEDTLERAPERDGRFFTVPKVIG